MNPAFRPECAHWHGTLHGARCSAAATRFLSPPLEERVRERRPLRSTCPRDGREEDATGRDTEGSAAYATPKAAEPSPSPLQKERGLGRGVPQCRLSSGLGSIWTVSAKYSRGLLSPALSARGGEGEARAHRSEDGYKGAACYHHQGGQRCQSERWIHPAIPKTTEPEAP